MVVGPSQISKIFILWLIGANIAITLAQMHIWPATVIAFVSIILLPGMVMLRVLHSSFTSVLEMILYAFALGILFLILCGLACNQLVPFLFNVSTPLTLPWLWPIWNIATLILLVVAGTINWHPQVYPRVRLRRRTFIMVLLPAILPLLAAMGAFRLNNGADDVVAMACLIGVATLLSITIAWRRKLSDAELAWCIFHMGLAILLMTSLRSFDITGHDLAREFHVFTLTSDAARWDMRSYRDAYNACLSITILPQFLGQMLGVSGLVLFKFVLQIFSALCPVAVYILLRRFVGKGSALVGIGLFISYPTFINDSAMLTRQGLAYFFLALAWGAVMGKHYRGRPSKILFLLCAVGMVLSHYSTTYVCVGTLILALGTKMLFAKRLELFANKKSLITPAVVLAVALCTFCWYGGITGTANNLRLTLQNTVRNLPSIFSGQNKSTDASSTLFFSSERSVVEIYDSYLQESQAKDVEIAPMFTPQITEDSLPLTKLGRTVKHLGWDPSSASELRALFGKSLQLVALVSVAFAVYAYFRKRDGALPLDILCLSVASVGLLAVIVVAPTVSINYGILRAFQQGLLLLLVPMVVLAIHATSYLKDWAKASLAITGMAGIFLLFSGWTTQVFGGASPALTLNNNGLYYGLYYTSRADLLSYAWLKNNISPHQDVRAANLTKAAMHDPAFPFQKTGILPGQFEPSSYIFLDQAQVVRKRFYVYHDSSPLVLTFPLDYYQTQKDQIYSTRTTGVYR